MQLHFDSWFRIEGKHDRRPNAQWKCLGCILWRSAGSVWLKMKAFRNRHGTWQSRSAHRAFPCDIACNWRTSVCTETISLLHHQSVPPQPSFLECLQVFLCVCPMASLFWCAVAWGLHFVRQRRTGDIRLKAIRDPKPPPRIVLPPDERKGFNEAAISYW